MPSSAVNLNLLTVSERLFDPLRYLVQRHQVIHPDEGMVEQLEKRRREVAFADSTPPHASIAL